MKAILSASSCINARALPTARFSQCKLASFRWIFYLTAIIAVCGCAPQANDGDEQKIQSLQQKVDQLSGQLDSVSKNYGDLSGKVLALSVKSSDYDSANFDPVSGQGYELLDIGVGRVMVAIQDIKPYADGVRIQLKIGNPNAVTIDGLDGDATYGPSWAKTQQGMSYDDWISAQKKTPVQISDELLPGRWNNVSISVPGVRPEDFGRIEFSLKGNRVQLYR